MSNVAVVKRVVDQILAAGDLETVRQQLADDVVFTVAIPEGIPGAYDGTGPEAVIDYFRNLGDIVTFWQVMVFERGEYVVVVGNESFTIENSELSARSDFALVFEVGAGLIVRVLVIEDLSGLLRNQPQLSELRNRLEEASTPKIDRKPLSEVAALVPG
jgi:ketosteroid isomerase-like protein